MNNYPFIKSNKDVVYALNMLSTFKEYVYELMNGNHIDIKSYVRIKSGIEYLEVDLKNLTEKNVEEVSFSFDILNEVKRNSKLVQLEMKEIKVKGYIEIVAGVIARSLQIMLKNENKEIAEKDVDNVLKLIQLIDKEIDDKQ